MIADICLKGEGCVDADQHQVRGMFLISCNNKADAI